MDDIIVEAADVIEDLDDVKPFVTELIISEPTDVNFDEELLKAFVKLLTFVLPKEVIADLNEATPLVSRPAKPLIKVLSLFAADMEVEITSIFIPATDSE